MSAKIRSGDMTIAKAVEHFSTGGTTIVQERRGAVYVYRGIEKWNGYRIGAYWRLGGEKPHNELHDLVEEGLLEEVKIPIQRNGRRWLGAMYQPTRIDLDTARREQQAERKRRELKVQDAILGALEVAEVEDIFRESGFDRRLRAILKDD